MVEGGGGWRAGPLPWISPNPNYDKTVFASGSPVWCALPLRSHSDGICITVTSSVQPNPTGRVGLNPVLRS